MKIRVYYEDTDAGGIVYHANYIKFCERARSELFFQKGMMPSEDNHSGFVVKDLKASFLSMAILGDMLEVKSSLLKQRASSILLEQNIYRDATAIFTMEILLVYVREGKPTRIPLTHREFFDEIQKS